MSVAVRTKVRHNLQSVDGRLMRDRITAFNDLYPEEFYPLESQHIEHGHWFTIEIGDQMVAFAGYVPFVPFTESVYFKRVAVLPEFRGYGFQRALMRKAEGVVGAAGYTRMISTTDVANIHSSNNFIKEGWRLVNPEKPWEPTSLYWVKDL
jgi:ribosomal protein S18 acetylase RimI-like enzyme